MFTSVLSSIFCPVPDLFGVHLPFQNRHQVHPPTDQPNIRNILCPNLIRTMYLHPRSGLSTSLAVSF